MRAHAAAQFTLTHFGAWRWAVRLISAVLASVVAAWVGSDGSPARTFGSPMAAGLIMVLLVWLVAVQSRDRPVNLHWDGGQWSLGQAGVAALEPLTGELEVAVDLGVWMLLRFTANDPSSRPRVHWVPAQRAGHAPQWHALRCAVYSPRPDAGVDAAPDV